MKKIVLTLLTITLGLTQAAFGVEAAAKHFRAGGTSRSRALGIMPVQRGQHYELTGQPLVGGAGSFGASTGIRAGEYAPYTTPGMQSTTTGELQRLP